MGLYLTKSGDAGVMKVTIYDNAVAFHAGACFEEFPMLRPATKVDCHIEEIIDGKGKTPQPGPESPDKPETNPES